MLAVLIDQRAAQVIGSGRKGMMALAFAAALAGFVAHETRAADPVVNFALFRIRMFTWSVLSLLLVATANSMATFLMPFYLQDVLGLSPSFMGVLFLAAPVFTIACANASGRLTDRIGPRVPASIGALVTMGAFVIGLVLRTDSSWLWPTALLALTGLGSGFFNAPNQTAIIGSVPREYRGFATGMVQTLFGVGSLLGISLAGVLLTILFRYHTGNPDMKPGSANPAAFVASMNATYFACVTLMAGALLASLMRGRDKVGAAEPGRG
jgi:MFS family permease